MRQQAGMPPRQVRAMALSLAWGLLGNLLQEPLLPASTRCCATVQSLTPTIAYSLFVRACRQRRQQAVVCMTPPPLLKAEGRWRLRSLPARKRILPKWLALPIA